MSSLSNSGFQILPRLQASWVSSSNQLKFNLNPNYVKGRPQEVLEATCSADKARKLLNYETKVSLSDGVKKTYDYIKKRGPKDFNYRLTIEIDNDLTPDSWKNKEI